MFRLILTSLAAVLLLLGNASAQNYSLQPGDLIEVTVLEDPTLNREALVRPDGKVSLPLAGTVTAGGRSPEQVQASVRAALRKSFVEPPTVTVSLLALAPEEEPEEEEEEILPAIFVLGEVGDPGRFEYEYEKPVNVLQALSMAGGLDIFAAAQRIQVRRRVDGVEEIIYFNYEAVEEGGAIDELVVLGEGDVVVVPERGLFE